MGKSLEQTVHQRVIRSLAERMSCNGYNSIETNRQFTNPNNYECPDGEFDVLGIEGDSAVIIEVKQSDSSSNRRKAKKQLIKCAQAARDLYGCVNVFLLYAYSSPLRRERHPDKPYFIERVRA